MPVSQVSQVYKSDPYVIPLDLNLLGRVLSIKQAKFDENAKNIQTGVNKLGALDILHPTKKAYANQKVNELVSGINDMGGVDLGDANISNQIEGMGANIYNDPNIIEGLASTASIRKLQGFYEKAKTDPKLNKLYAPQNEEHDMDPVSQYLSDPSLEAKYSGGSSPTPYVNFKNDLIKNIQGVKANLVQTYDTRGNLIYVTKDHEEVTPERITQMARDLTTPEQQNQMNIDADYNGKRSDPNDLVSRAIAVHNSKITSATSTLMRYTELLNSSSNDPLAHARYDGLVKMQQGEIDQLAAVKPADFLAKYKEDPKTFNRGLYADEMYRGLGERFAYHKDTQKITPNFATMFNMNYEQKERFHRDEMAYKEDALAAKGLKKDKDGKLVPIEPAFTVKPPNTEDPNAQPAGEEAFKGQIQEYKDKNTVLLNNFLASWVNENPDLGTRIESTQSGSGIAFELKGQKLLEEINGVPGLQIEDFNILSQNRTDPRYVKFKKQGVNVKELQAYQNLYNTYNQLATGQDAGVKKFPDGFRNMVEQIQINGHAITSIEDKMNSVNTQLRTQFKLTDNDLKAVKALEDYRKRNDAYTGTNTNDYSKDGLPGLIAGAYETLQNLQGTGKNLPLTPEEKKLFGDRALLGRINNYYDVTNSNEYKLQRDAIYNQAINRPVYSQPIISNGYFGKQSINAVQKLAAGILHDKGDIRGVKTDLVPSDLEIISAGKSSGTSPYTMTVATKDDKGNVTYSTIGLDTDQYKQFGFQEGPYDALNESVILRGKSQPMIVSAPRMNTNVPGRTNPLAAKIVLIHKNPNDRNDFTTKAVIVDKNGKQITMPGTTMASPAQSYAAAKAYIQTLEDEGRDYDYMINQITEDSYKEQ